MIEQADNIIDSGKAERDQGDREASYRTLLENLPDIVYRLHLRGTRYLQFFNDRITELTGFSPDEFTPGRICSMESRMVKDDSTRAKEILDRAIHDRAPFEVEYRFICKNGTIITLLEKGTVVCDNSGVPLFVDGVIRDISDRKAMENALLRSENRWRSLLETSVVWIWETDADIRHIYTNAFVTTCLGYQPEEFLRLDIQDLIHADDQDAVKTIVQNARNGITGWTDRILRWRHKDGSWRHIESSGSALFDTGGTFVGLRGVDRDVTERVLAEEALRESAEQLRSLSANLADGMVYQISSGPDGLQRRFTYISPAVEHFHGLKAEDAMRDPSLIYNQVVEKDRVTVAGQEALAYAARTRLDIEVMVRLPSGDLRWRRFISSPRAIPDGSLIWDGIEFDITERKRAKEALRKSERMLQTIIDAEPECVKVLDSDSRLVMMNRAGLAMIEADSLEQVKGQCICPMVSSEYQPAFMDLTRRIFQGDSGTLVFEIVGLKGRHLWLETHAVPLRNEKDEIVALLGVTRDVTERMRVDEALRASESRFRTIIESATSGILVADAETRKFVYANPEICRMLGYPREELLTLDIRDIHPLEEMERVQTAFAGQNELQTLCRRKDGTTLSVEIKPVAIELEGRDCLAGFFSDISEKRLLEEERLKTQKLESIGTLAGGIAHDFNNLLQGLFGYISMAKMAMDRPEQLKDMLDQAEEALHLSVNLTTQLLTFSKGGLPAKKLIRLDPAIENAVKFALSGSHTAYTLEFQKDLWPVEADEGQLSQVIQNIVLNAHEAMAGGGTVHISAENADIPAETIPGLPDGGNFLRIAITDSGIGIPEKYIARIFDPYFTTKQKGSGLGLATSYSIIRNHGGNIAVNSEVNKGSTFTIYLPATQYVEMASDRIAPVTVKSKKGKILLMDDEALVCHVGSAMIAALGHEVECAKDGKKAIELYKKAQDSDNPFDLLILDLTIRGGMGGEEAISILRQMDPGVVAVVSSGYADSPVIANYRAYGFAAFLNKPYKINALRDCLTGLLKQS